MKSSNSKSKELPITNRPFRAHDVSEGRPRERALEFQTSCGQVAAGTAPEIKTAISLNLEAIDSSLASMSNMLNWFEEALFGNGLEAAGIAPPLCPGVRGASSDLAERAAAVEKRLSDVMSRV